MVVNISLVERLTFLYKGYTLRTHWGGLCPICICSSELQTVSVTSRYL